MDLSIKVDKSATLCGIRGIIAIKNIAKKELIESCPVIIFPKTQDKLIDSTVLGSYDYDWDKENSCFVIGYCVLTNHSYNPNCRYERDFSSLTMNYIALKEIAIGEEILINYNGDPSDTHLLNERYTNHLY